MLKLIGVGDNTIDTYVFKKRRFPGGNAVNVAVLAKRYGAESAYLGAFGGDENGRLLTNALRKEGIDLSHCKYFPDIENAYAEVDWIDGEREFGAYSSGAAELLKLTEDDFGFINKFDIVHSSIYSYLDDQIPLLRKNSKFLSFDFSNHLTEVEYIERIVPHIDLAVCSVEGHSGLDLGSFAKELIQRGLEILICTQGKEGSWVFDKAGGYHQDIVEIEVVDTMGAGDAYIAAFLIEYRSGTPIQECMRRAAVFASETCKYEGAFGHGEVYA